MKSILVTGGCGFIGANFIRYLLDEAGYEGRVVNVDSLTYAGNPLSLTDLAEHHPERYVFVKEDICNRERLAAVFNEYDVDAVCHFAAETHVDRSIADPEPFVQTNIIGTYNLLELARAEEGGIEVFHHVSTDEVFGHLGPEGLFREDTPYDPRSPYSASKASSDHLVRAYHTTYALPVTISNCSNNYGPFQFPEKLVPLMILNAYEGKGLPVYGDGMNVRDWLYVRDHAIAVWEIMNRGERGETYNIGARNEMPNLHIVGLLCDIVDEIAGPLAGHDSRRDLITFVEDRPGHDRRYAIDCTKLESDLGWHPRESFETGLRKTVQWYLDNREWTESVRSGDYQDWIRQHYG